jgi:signal transduction histidine kinase
VYDGLLGRRFHARAICKSAVTGEIFVGGPLGLTAFHPDSIRDNSYIPPIKITSFKRYHVDHERAVEIEEKGITMRDRLELSYKDNILTFEFAALSFRNAAKNQYAYKLQGFNDDWIQLGTKREITFTNLDPGEYVLHVRGSNNDGVWNEAGASLEITIAPPWWRTWWAYALYGLMIFGFLYGLRRYEMNRQQWKHGLELERVESDKLKELDSLKSHFFANISHEFRTPLTLILGPIENLRQRLADNDAKQELSMMQRNAHRLLRLINQLLDLSRLEAGKLKLEAPG